jgi:hypothetical protein
MKNSGCPAQRRSVAEGRRWYSLGGFPPLCVAVVVQLVNAPLAAQADSIPLVTWEDLLPARRGVLLWVKNPTADTVWLDSLHVEACLNIRRPGCGTRPLGIALPPGSSTELHRLEPAVPSDAFSYRWFLDWKTATMDSTRPRPRRPRRRL